MAASSTPAAIGRFLVVNGVPRAGEAPPISTLLESLPGAYSTTRTHFNASIILFWQRHLDRLVNSARILSDRRPDFLGSPASADLSSIRPLVGMSLRVGLGLALSERDRRAGMAEEVSELAITALVGGGGSGSGDLDVYLHIGFYVPPVFGDAGARLAVAGRGREVAQAKYSQWARIRKDLERMRPPMVTELLLSTDGDQILEGSVTNFFVVRKVVPGETDDSSDLEKELLFEVQTAPITDGVLPGIIRQVIIEICYSSKIPFREVAPSWRDYDLWQEAFITSGLRLVQHVESVQAPNPCKDFHLKNWNDVAWVVKKFEGVGPVTTLIQRELLARLGAEGCQLSRIL